jgi:hypothetical protein
MAHVATGIIDPQLALRPPEADYIQRLGGQLQAFTLTAWCAPWFQLSDPYNLKPIDNGGIVTSTIARMYRINRTSASAAQWIVYTKDGNNPGEIKRVGPGIISGWTSNQPLLKTADGPAVPGTFVDLVLHEPAGPKVASCGS